MTHPARTLIAGVPRSGKTTLALKLGAQHGIPVRHIDELIGVLDWSETSAEVASWLDEPGPWIIEGVQAARALRKWLEMRPEGAPVDLIIHLEQPYRELTRGQATMAKGCLTVWGQIAAEVARRGAPVRGML